nr:hypothetical protein FFPRI1PSEUD_27540 [Pseudomonas sp. FFPRI_1]
MLSAQQACARVLADHAGILREGVEERFVIQSCTLTTRGDYWAVCCNSEDYVVHGLAEYCYVGVSAHLVDVETGAIETVANCTSVEEYLQDKYDLRAAAGSVYVLAPAFGRDDKPALINLRRKLACTYPQALALLSGEQAHWLTASRRRLQEAQRLLASQGIATRIELAPEVLNGIEIDVEVWYAEAALEALRKRLA